MGRFNADLGSEVAIGDVGWVTSDRSTDEELVVAIARGERLALSTLYERHVELLLALATRLLRDPREAEDLVHDVMLEVWREAGEFDPSRGAVRTWLLMRLRSRALDRLRSARSRRLTLGEDRDDVPISESQTALVDGRRAVGALGELREDHRRVLELCYFDGLSSTEIAGALGIPVGTVKSRVSAAMGQLRRMLGVSRPMPQEVP